MPWESFTTKPGASKQLSSTMTFKNLVVLFGVVVPFGLIFRRKGRK
jgi:hypothetical protein